MLAEPDLLVSNRSLEINSDAPVFTLTLRNIGEDNSVLEWEVDKSSPSLLVTPASGSLAQGERTFVSVEVDRGTVLVAEDTEEKLTFRYNGGNKDIYVQFSIKPSGNTLAGCGQFPEDTDTRSLDGVKRLSAQRPLPTPGSPYVADEVLVSYRPASGLTTQALEPSENHKRLAQQLSASYGFSVKRDASGARPAVLKVPAGEDPAAFAERLKRDPRIEYAEPNYYLQLQSVPNDPLYTEQWHLREFGLEQAWDIETGTGDVTIAIIDSGIDRDHADLAGRILPGCDFHDQDNDFDPGDGLVLQSQHGTHVAGIVGALGDNAEGVAGVAYGSGVKLLPVKLFSDAGFGATLDMLVDALLWLAGEEVEGMLPNPNPPKIINMSIGADPEAVSSELRSLRRATDRVSEAGILMIASSGNYYREDDNYEPFILIPAADPNVLAVGSVDSDYRRSGFSQYGADGETVDLMAPGGFAANGLCEGIGVLSSVNYTDGERYACQAGTSMAAPFVAGVAALLWSQNPALTAEQVKDRLISTAYYDDTYMTSEAYGSGVVCADRALGAATRCGR